MLLLTGLILVAGIVGEYAKSEKWKRHRTTFELLVIIGVCGELLADGGIFLFSRHLQTISEAEVRQLELTATELRLATNEANARAALANLQAKEADEHAGGANARATKLEHTTELLRKENEESAASLEAEKAKRIELAVSLLPRKFIDQSGAVKSLKLFSNISARIEYLNDHECLATAEQINFVLRQAWGQKVPGKPGDEMMMRDGVFVSPGIGGYPVNTGGFAKGIAPERIAAIRIYQKNLADTRAAAEALKDELNKSPRSGNLWVTAGFSAAVE